MKYKELSQKIRRSKKYVCWRSEVFKRDNYTCIKCKTKKLKLNAHHVITFKKILEDFKISTIKEANRCGELWYVGNGATLCCACHDKLHGIAYSFVRDKEGIPLVQKYLPMAYAVLKNPEEDERTLLMKFRRGELPMPTNEEMDELYNSLTPNFVTPHQ